MRFELIEGGEWRGDYPTRHGAMADAELIAAKRGQTLTWTKLSETTQVGAPHPAEEQAGFIVRLLPGAKWKRRA